MDNKKESSLESPGTWKIKVGVLLTLCCQNAGHALVARYSQVRGDISDSCF